MNPDHRESMESCEARVAAWLAEFSAEMEARPENEMEEPAGPEF